jgi:hypothetical protein
MKHTLVYHAVCLCAVEGIGLGEVLKENLGKYLKYQGRNKLSRIF